MNIIKRKYIYILLFFIFIVSIKTLFAQSVGSVSQYNSQINQDNQQIQQLQTQETSLQNALNSQIANKNTILSNLYNINSNIYTYESNISKIKILISNLNSLNIKNREKIKKDIIVRNNIESSIYINMQTNPIYYIFSSKDFNNAIVTIYLSLSQLSSYKNKIISINNEINTIKTDLLKQKNFENTLITEENNLKPVQQTLYSNLNQYNNSINSTNNTLNQVGGQISALQADIQRLNNLETLAQAKASTQTSSPPSEINPNPLSSCNNNQCNFQFTSYGFGNPMGMSQYGMLGMANQGSNASQIATNYYQGSSISAVANLDNTIVNVPGYGKMTLQNYLAGIGEVPNSWPNQAIEAQIIISRSYVLYRLDSCSDYSSCTPTVPTNINIPSTGTDFQVYDGGTAKMSEVIASENQVLTYNGSLVNAFFSSSNGGYEESIGTVECVLWNNCNYSSFLSNYLKAQPDPYDTSTANVDPSYQYANPAMNTTQLINIVNTAQALCAGVNSCYLFNNNNGSNSFDNAYSTDNSNTNYNNSSNDTFTNINQYLTSNGISPINSIVNFSISTMGHMPSEINVVSLHHNITINAGVFWLAFLLVSPNYSNFNDDLVGFRYTVNITGTTP